MKTNTKVTRKKTTRPAARPAVVAEKKPMAVVASKSYAKSVATAAARAIQKAVIPPTKRIHPVRPTRPSRASSGTPSVNRQTVRLARIPQFNYMKAPGVEHGFEVGNTVEVFCDHERDGERVRGWIKGIVVQIDNKLVAVQFRSNVFLTDGWMVPDRILWYSLTSDQIRAATLAKRGNRKTIPDY